MKRETLKQRAVLRAPSSSHITDTLEHSDFLQPSAPDAAAAAITHLMHSGHPSLWRALCCAASGCPVRMYVSCRVVQAVCEYVLGDPHAKKQV